MPLISWSTKKTWKAYRRRANVSPIVIRSTAPDNPIQSWVTSIGDLSVHVDLTNVAEIFLRPGVSFKPVALQVVHRTGLPFVDVCVACLVSLQYCKAARVWSTLNKVLYSGGLGSVGMCLIDNNLIRSLFALSAPG
ncbi:Amine oxidase [flavin-containing] B [Fusarium oxysporum f. sp. albedinis]|nr:Amine oxidase [flavin-containing] B [Fusarium oxysporum f. sp. albedinis]